MRIEDFTNPTTGELVSVNLPSVKFAFDPAPLPPPWPWPEALWSLLLKAREALARLDGTTRHLTQPALLLRPLQNREAITSSQIEGTFATPEQLLLFEAEATSPKGGAPSNQVEDWREVHNYRRALEAGWKLHTEYSFSLRLMKHLHKVLLSGGVRGESRDPGEFRRIPVHIGEPPRFVPPPSNRVLHHLDLLEKFVHSDFSHDKLVAAFLIHYQFETIHPFMDGNGRVGRLLLSLMIASWAEMKQPWIYLSPYFDKNKDEYIRRLYTVSTQGDWAGWIEFCLRGVVAQADDILRRCDKLVDLKRRYHQLAEEKGGSIKLSTVIDDLFVSPFVRVAHVSRRRKVTYPTAQSYCETLAKLGVLREMVGRYPRTFYAPEIVSVSFDPDPPAP